MGNGRPVRDSEASDSTLVNFTPRLASPRSLPLAENLSHVRDSGPIGSMPAWRVCLFEPLLDIFRPFVERSPAYSDDGDEKKWVECVKRNFPMQKLLGLVGAISRTGTDKQLSLHQFRLGMDTENQTESFRHSF